MKKKLNPEAIVNELQGASGFFPRAVVAAADDVESPTPASIAPAPTPIRVEADEPPPPVRPGRAGRVMKNRHPFDIYQDQYDSLRQLAAQERLQGGIGSMSAMVRKALDAFIAQRAGSAIAPYGPDGSRQADDDEGK